MLVIADPFLHQCPHTNPLSDKTHPAEINFHVFIIHMNKQNFLNPLNAVITLFLQKNKTGWFE